MRLYNRITFTMMHDRNETITLTPMYNRNENENDTSVG